MKVKVSKFLVNNIPMYVRKVDGVSRYNYQVRFFKDKKSAITVAIEKPDKQKLEKIALESYEFLKESYFNKKKKDIKVFKVK